MEKRFWFLLFTCLFIFACNRQNTESQDSNLHIPTEDEGRPVPEELVNETNVDDDALLFMKTAAHDGAMEIELGKLAQEKAQNQRVKDFGAMMVKDHSLANNALMQLGTEKNVVVNYAMTPEQKEHLNKLKKLSGSAFDKEYINMMVNDHVKAIESFKRGADNRDEQVNAFANQRLPVLKKHLDSAKAIQASIR